MDFPVFLPVSWLLFLALFLAFAPSYVLDDEDGVSLPANWLL
jgi:hypothetical protein